MSGIIDENDNDKHSSGELIYVNCDWWYVYVWDL